MRKYGYRQKEITIKPAEEAKDLSHLHFEEGYIFPKETITALQGLCEILRGIRTRLLQEGYSIMEGKLISPEGKVVYERNKSKCQ